MPSNNNKHPGESPERLEEVKGGFSGTKPPV